MNASQVSIVDAGKARARQGTARRLHGGEGRRGAAAMDSATARRLHDGEGRRGATAMGCGDGSSKAREGASVARDGATATRR